MAQSSDGHLSAESLEWFERDVRPLLAEHCYSCHSSTVAQPKGGLKLDTLAGILNGGDSGPAAVKGRADESLLVEAIRRKSIAMPPDKPLSRRDQATLERWVAVGLPWPDSSPSSPAIEGSAQWVVSRAATHWAWQAVRRQSPPPSTLNESWALRPLDSFIAAELQANDVTPSPPADALTRLRRLSFDLIGLPPSREQAMRFSHGLTDSEYEAAVDQMLNSPQFGVHWGRHWLDLVRYSETLGHEFDYPIHNAWRYRDATIDGFNTDQPYAERIREHLAGDLIAKPRIHPQTGINQSLASTGWWWMGDTVHAPVDVRTDWATRIDNQIDVLSKTFLGMTVACARCHDHKFDAISLKDYYGLAGIVQSSRRLYCPTDPHGTISAHQHKYDQLRQHSEKIAQASLRQAGHQTAEIKQWLVDLCTALQAQRDKLDAHLPISSALNLLRPAVAEDVPAAQATWRDELKRAQTAFQSWQDTSQLYADFSHGIPSGWTVHDASEAKASEYMSDTDSQPFDWFAGKTPVPSRSHLFTSLRFGRQSTVILQSPSFEVKLPNICLKIRGKATNSVVHVSNYFMHEFTGLLFADLRKVVDQPADNGWLNHGGDLVKYLGYPAFLSLEDTDAGWFELQEVRFAEHAPPVQPFVIVELIDKEFTGRGELLDYLADRLALTLQSGLSRADVTNVAMLREAILLTDKLDLRLPLLATEPVATATAQLRELDAITPPATTLTAVGEGTPVNAALAIRGNAHQLGEPVARGCFHELEIDAAIPAESSGRWELAQSWSSGKHPLIARVMVNRVWHHLLGSGLVSSTDNLGVLGGRPTHPALLDYLATEFVRHDWSIKWLVREIVLSQTYQLSSSITEQQRELDADGRLWSHRAVKRLTGEALRDAMLAVANSLDVRLGEPSTAIHLTEQMTGRGRPGKSGPLDGDNRRSMFIEVRRNFLDPFLMAFDFPMPATSVGKRNVSNVPAQALGLLNDPLVAEVAQRWSHRLTSTADLGATIQAMFVTAYARMPTETEMRECLELIQLGGDDAQQRSQAWNDLAHVLLNAKEFSYVR